MLCNEFIRLIIVCYHILLSHPSIHKFHRKEFISKKLYSPIFPATYKQNMTIPAGFHTVSGANNRVTGTKSGQQGHQSFEHHETPHMDVSHPQESFQQMPEAKKAPAGADRQQLCIDLLMAGCVQSFIDYFYIVNRRY